jgi:hypothetical protein
LWLLLFDASCLLLLLLLLLLLPADAALPGGAAADEDDGCDVQKLHNEATASLQTGSIVGSRSADLNTT